MKKTILSFALMSVLGLSGLSCSKKVITQTTSTLSSSDSVAYAFGIINGESFRKMLKTLPGDSLNEKAILDGFSAGLQNRDMRMNEGEARSLFQNYIKGIQEKENTLRSKQNDSILSINKNRPGVQVTASGLQYRVLTEGKGNKPNAQDTVMVHYAGKLIDGTEFDSSYKRGEPATFPLNQVIPGWTEGVALMNIGSKYEFYIPSSLAYGERGAGSAIPPNSTLIFEIELLDIKPYQEAKSAEIKESKTNTPQVTKQTTKRRKARK